MTETRPTNRDDKKYIISFLLNKTSTSVLFLSCRHDDYLIHIYSIRIKAAYWELIKLEAVEIPYKHDAEEKDPWTY
jgi:hypothetical protein